MNRSAGRLITCAVVITFCAAAQDDPASVVDPRFVGTWELNVQNVDRWVLRFERDGKYAFTIEGPGNQPGHSGVFQAVGGKWSLRSTAGTPWTDGGTYRFLDQDTVSMTGNLGPASWKRRSGAGQASDATTVAGDASVSRIAPLVAAARVSAGGWQQDAKLTAVYVKAGPDGRVDLKNLAGPSNFAGGFVAMHLHSAAAGMVQTYGLDAGGRVVAQGPPMPAGTEIAPIPARFLDLDAALVKAKALGMKPLAAGSNGFVDARIVGVRGEGGAPAGATWTITVVDMSGAFPMPAGEPIVLNAASGEETTEEALSGRLDRRLLAEELTRGKTYHESQRDYLFHRGESDAWAAKWNKDLKLCAMELSGSYVADRLVLDRARFYYFTASTELVGGWSVTTVAVFPYGGSMLLRVDELDKHLAPAEVRPQVVPDVFLAPDAAVAKLRGVDPKLRIDPVNLALVFSKGRWLWFSSAERTVREKTSIFVYDRPYLEAVAIDAVTGAAVLKGDAAATPHLEKQPRRVDPALVGAWVGMRAREKVTIEFTQNGDFRFSTRTPQGVISKAGLIDMSDGKWALELSDGASQTGTYRLVDPDTLEWTDKDAETVTMKRIPGGARPPRVPPPEAAPGIPRPITMDDLDTVPKLVALLKSNDSSHRELAAYRLGVMAVSKRDEVAAAVPGLVETLRDRFPVTRANAAIALGNVGPGARAAVTALAGAIRDPDRRAREGAAKALGQIGADPSVAVPALASALADNDMGVRSHAAVSLGQFGEAAAGGAEALGAALADPAPGVSIAAAEALARIGKDAGAAAPALAAALRHRNAHLRQSVAKALAQLGPGARVAVPALSAALRDESPSVASAAAEALGSIGPDAAASVPALVDALKNPAVAVSAAQALCRIPDPSGIAVPAIVAMLDRTGDLSQSYARGQIILSLGALGAGGRPAVPILVKILRDDQEHAENRKAAADALQKLGPAAEDSVASLADHVKDKTAAPQSRSDAAKVLGAIGAAARSAIPVLSQVVNDPAERDDVRYDAAKAREKILGG